MAAACVSAVLGERAPPVWARTIAEEVGLAALPPLRLLLFCPLLLRMLLDLLRHRNSPLLSDRVRRLLQDELPRADAAPSLVVS